MANKKKMGVIQLTLLTMVNMMGSGIIMLPTQLAKVGSIAILSWFVTAVGATLLAYSFAQAGRYSRHEGGMGGYAEYTFGKAGGFLANYAYLISLIIANIAIAVSAVGYGVTFLGLDGKVAPVIIGMSTIATLWLATVLNFGGAGITGKISEITVWGVIAPVLFLCILGWFWFHPSLFAQAWNPHGDSPFSAISSSIAMTLWAFLGIESASANSDAVEDPEKNVPLAVMGGTIGAAILYVLGTSVVFGISNVDDIANSSGPFGLVFSQMLSPTVGKIVLGLMVVSCFGSLLGWQFTIANVARSMAVEHNLPPAFAKISKNGAPIIGMVIITVIQSLLALMTISPSLSEQFEQLVNLAVITNVVPYILSLSALPVMIKLSDISGRKYWIITTVALIAAIYAMYALYTAGMAAMMGGALATFAGWIIYGMMAPRFIEDHPRTEEGHLVATH